MRFELPNATAAMNEAVVRAGDGDGDAWDVIGQPLDRPVDELATDYGRKLELDLDPTPGDKRREITGLHWGRISKDVGRLKGLAAAIDNIAGVIKAGKDQLAHDWKGEAFDAFRTAIEKIEKTLGDYSTAVKGAAANLETGLTSIQTAYTRYRDDTTGSHLNFRELSPPNEWWKMSGDSGRFLAENCTSYHVIDMNCCYNDDQQVALINERFVSDRLFDRLQSWDCTDETSVVIDQYGTTVRAAEEERSAISGKINNWYRATDQLKSDVDKLFAAALDTLQGIAETKPFQQLRLIGATAPAGAGTPSGGYPGGGYSGGYPGGGEFSGGGGTPSAAIPEATPPSEPPTPPEPAAAESPSADSPSAESPSGTVEIKDAGRTIAVSSLTGEGHVTVTVQDATGATTTYDLDFDAASGLPVTAPGEPAPNTEHIEAGTNGKCVIQNGEVTITAERSLFDANTITLTVDDGDTEPSTYTVDFAAADDTGTSQDAPGIGGTEPDSTRTSASPDSTTEPPGPTGAPEPADAERPANDVADRGTGTADAAAEGASRGGAADEAATDAAGESAEHVVDGSVSTVGSDGEQGVDLAGETVGSGANGTAAGAGGDGADTTAGSSGTRPSIVDPPATGPVGDVTGESVAEATATQGAPPPPVPAVAADGAAAVSGDSAGETVSQTAAQDAAQDDPRGRLSGVLLSDGPEPGEPGLASAGTGDAGGAAGSALPMMAGAAPDASEPAGRAGTGWSVHGDLFDSGDPVYSMHGVLGEDELKSQ